MPKPIKQMSASQINKALDKLDAKDSKFNHAMIEAGRGNERFSEWSTFTDKLSREGLSLYHMRMDLRNEIERRYGPGAPSRLPRGFGPLRNRGKRAKAARMSNPSASFEEAADLSREFHGREPETVEEIDEVEEYDKNLAGLGELEELSLITEDNTIVPISFNDCDVRLAAKGNQLSFVGGDQKLDLEALASESQEIASQAEVEHKNLLDLGEVYSIVYFTDKHHLAGAKAQKDGSSYEHVFAEENRRESRRPRLMYDRRNEKMSLVGGSYKIKVEGIWD